MIIFYFFIAMLLLGIIVILAKINAALVCIYGQLLQLNTKATFVDEGKTR